jgi:4-hydroxy-tetrahydrodipicolinate reductase
MRLKIGIVGAGGRMGQALVREIAADAQFALAAACDRPGLSAIGKDAGALAGLEPLAVAIGDSPALVVEASQAVIDFTAPDATANLAPLCALKGVAHIVGTTGLTPTHEAALKNAAQKIPVVYAPNMSVGVTLLSALTEKVASLLGEEFDIEIVEMHHRMKRDAPSGTALGLGRAAAKGRGVSLDQTADHERWGEVGARVKGKIGFAALRGGDVVGDHTVIFAAEGERIELTHKASSRTIFARGAVRAAAWAVGKPPGLYTMRDVLAI